MTITDHYLPLLCQRGVIPQTQFARAFKSSTVDLLRVPNDHIWFRWQSSKLAIIVVDDIRHAYGLVVHQTLQAI